MKKKLLIVSLFAMLLCLSACNQEIVLPKDFEADRYSNFVQGVTVIVTATQDLQLNIYAHEAEEHFTSEDLGFDPEVYKSLCAGTLTAKEEAGTPIQLTNEVQYEVSGINKDIVTIIVPVQYTDYTVNYEYTFEPNPKAEYNPFVEPYMITQAVVATQYPKSELMKMAGMNTLMGMGVVFLVLIFISFIISLFKYMPGSGAKQLAKKQAEPKQVQAPIAAPVAAAPAASEDLMDNQELVAVITAAVIAASGSASGMVSSDKLIVRSIKRASR